MLPGRRSHPLAEERFDQQARAFLVKAHAAVARGRKAGQAEKKAYRPGGDGAQAYRPVLSTRQAGMPAPLGARRFAGVGSRGSDTGASVLSACSVSSVDSVDSEFSEEFCCPRNLREGESGRRAFVKLRWEGEREEKSFFAKRTHYVF